MLHLKFAEALSGSSNGASNDAKPHAIDPGVLMRLVSRNTKRGAQFTPQGILRWPIPSAKAEDVITETRALLDALEPQR
jgi:transcription-repair coupling factor (superfamily II helicase)